MTFEQVRSALAWCIVMNFGILVLWFGFIALAHDWTFNFHSKWYKISEEKFDTVHYAGIAFFKSLVITFNLVPYLALRIVG